MRDAAFRRMARLTINVDEADEAVACCRPSKAKMLLNVAPDVSTALEVLLRQSCATFVAMVGRSICQGIKKSHRCLCRARGISHPVERR